MSPRNFTRVFTRDVGVPPARYVTEARPPPHDSFWSRPRIRLRSLPKKRVWDQHQPAPRF